MCDSSPSDDVRKINERKIARRLPRRAAAILVLVLIYVSSAPPCSAFFIQRGQLLAGCFGRGTRPGTAGNHPGTAGNHDIATTCTASGGSAVIAESWEGMKFGPHLVEGDQIFYKSASGKTAAFVNLRYSQQLSRHALPLLSER